MPVPTERELHLLWAVTGLISPFYAQMEAVQGWCVAAGADPEAAKRYTASMYASLASLAEQRTGTGFRELAREAATPGGMNEMALGMTGRGSALPDLRDALDAILERFGEPLR
jgi:pyrroline-5-carboxylate reductase